MGQAGQATVEAVLVLSLSVVLILGIIYQFHDGFRNYIDNYFGNYVACLLETGELPGLGSEGGVCAEAMAALEMGEAGLGSSSPGEGGGDGGGSGSGGEPPERRARNAEGGGGGGPRTMVRAGRGGGASSAGSGTSEDGNVTSPPPESKSAASGVDTSAQNLGPVPMGRVRSQRKGAGEKIIVEDSALQTRERTREGERPARSEVSSDENDNALRASKLSFDPNSLAQPQTESVDEGPWQLGGYLRYFLVLVILIAIFVFVGGQALQIAKSREN